MLICLYSKQNIQDLKEQINKMLFQHLPPLFCKRIDNNKMVFLTKYRIIYSFIDTGGHSIHSILVHQNPLRLEHSYQRDETMVITQNSVQIYSCSNSKQIKLKKVLILHNQFVYSILKQSIKQWEIFGQIYQYSTKTIKIYPIEQKSQQQQTLGKVYVEQFEIYIQKDTQKINIYDHKKQMGQQIQWDVIGQTNNLQTYLKSLYISNSSSLKQNGAVKKKLQMKAHKLYISNKRITSRSEHNITINRLQNNKVNNINSIGLTDMNQLILNDYRTSKAVSGTFSQSLSLNEPKYFIILIQIDNKFIIILTPPREEYFNSHIPYEFSRLTSSNVGGSINSKISSSLSTNNYNQKLLQKKPSQQSSIIKTDIRQNNFHIKHSKNKWNVEILSLDQACQKTIQPLKSQQLESSISIIQFSTFHWKSQSQSTKLSKDLYSGNDYKPQSSQKNIFFSQYQNQFDFVWILQQFQKIQNRIIFTLIKYVTLIQQKQSFKQTSLNQSKVNIQQKNITNLFHQQQPQKKLLVQNYMLNFTQNQEDRQFQEVLKDKLTKSIQSTQNKSYNKKSQSKSLFQLTKIQPSSFNSNEIFITFIYYIPKNKNKLFSTIKIQALKLSDFKSNQKQTKNTLQKNQYQYPDVNKQNNTNLLNQSPSKTIPFNPRFTFGIKSPPCLLQTAPLTISQPLNHSQGITTSQPITTTLTLSQDTQLTFDLLSRIPSSTNSTPDQSSRLAVKVSKTILPQEDEGLIVIDNKINLLKMSRNKSSSLSSGKTNSFEQPLEAVSQQLFVNCQQNIAIPQTVIELPQQVQLQKTQQQEQQEIIEQVEQVMQVVEFNHNNDQSQQINKANIFNSMRDKNNITNTQNRQSDFNTKSIMGIGLFSKQTSKRQQSNQINREDVAMNSNDKYKQEAHIQEERQKPNTVNHSQEEDVQEEAQFLQKFITHLQHKRSSSQNKDLFNTKTINDSRQSYQKHFRGSKVSVQDKQKKQNMIGGRDISQIVHYKNRINSDSEQEDTVQLGQQIEKQYSKNYSKIMEGHTQNSKQNIIKLNKISNFNQQSQQTVIILNNLNKETDNPNFHQENFNNSHNQYSITDKYSQNQQNNHFGYSHHQNQNKSNSSAHHYYDNPITPGFNHDFHQDSQSNNSISMFKTPQVGIKNNDQWGNFTKKWEINNLNCAKQSLIKTSSIDKQNNKHSTNSSPTRQRYVTKSQFQLLSQKVKSFCSEPQRLTLDEIHEIQSKKYTQLMKQVFLRSEQKFNQLMKQFLYEIIREEQARLFFAEYIRTFSGRTRDILIRLYMSLKDDEDNKKYMSQKGWSNIVRVFK